VVTVLHRLIAERKKRALQMTEHGRGMHVTLWIAAVLLAAVFFVAGGAKIGGWLDAQFVAWGYSPGFAVVIGVFEVLFGIGLLGKRTATWAAFGLMAIMLGAAGTHLTHGEHQMLVAPILLLLLLGFVAWGRGPARTNARPRGLQRDATRPVPSRPRVK
jgi:uncharacterized membrane protein YphA (DoxX/SURF4 family)